MNSMIGTYIYIYIYLFPHSIFWLVLFLYLMNCVWHLKCWRSLFICLAVWFSFSFQPWLLKKFLLQTIRPSSKMKCLLIGLVSSQLKSIQGCLSICQVLDLLVTSYQLLLLSFILIPSPLFQIEGLPLMGIMMYNYLVLIFQKMMSLMKRIQLFSNSMSVVQKAVIDLEVILLVWLYHENFPII